MSKQELAGRRFNYEVAQRGQEADTDMVGVRRAGNHCVAEIKAYRSPLASLGGIPMFQAELSFYPRAGLINANAFYHDGLRHIEVVINGGDWHEKRARNIKRLLAIYDFGKGDKVEIVRASYFQDELVGTAVRLPTLITEEAAELVIQADDVYVESGIIITPLGSNATEFFRGTTSRTGGDTETIEYQTRRGWKSFTVKAITGGEGTYYRLCRLSDSGVPLVTIETPIPTSLPDIYRPDVSLSAEEAVRRWSNQVRIFIDPISFIEVKV